MDSPRQLGIFAQGHIGGPQEVNLHFSSYQSTLQLHIWSGQGFKPMTLWFPIQVPNGLSYGPLWTAHKLCHIIMPTQNEFMQLISLFWCFLLFVTSNNPLTNASGYCFEGRSMSTSGYVSDALTQGGSRCSFPHANH